MVLIWIVLTLTAGGSLGLAIVIYFLIQKIEELEDIIANMSPFDYLQLKRKK